MKILHIYKSFFPETCGGIEQMICQLSRITHALGCNNYLATTTQAKKIDTSTFETSLTVTRFPQSFTIASCPFSWQLFKDFHQLIAEVDIIHYHFPWPFADLLHLVKHVNKPSVVTYHADIFRQKLLKIPYHPVMIQFLKKVNAITTTSHNLVHSSKVLPQFIDKCHIIPIGVDEADYLPVQASQLNEWRNKIGENFILFVGVLRYYKGLSFLLEAVAGSQIPVVIAGDGPMATALHEQARKLQLTNVKFLGYLSNSARNAIYQLSRAVVLPAHLPTEAYGVSLVEGLLFGKPLISTNLGTGSSFVNQHNLTGLCVPPGDISALRTALQTIMDDDRLVEKMGKAARLRYEEKFGTELMGKAYFDLYQKVITNSL